MYSASQVGWITSLETCITVLGSVFVGRIFDIFGPTVLLMCGTVVMVFGVMMTSLCEQYYQFILAQGVCTALGAALLFNPCISSLGSWFIKKRATALGIANAGSSLGGIVIPIIFRRVQERAGFGWGVRSIGFVMLFFSLIACMTVSSRLRSPGRQKLEFKRSYIQPFFREPSFGVAGLAVFFGYWGLFIPITYVPSHAVAHGFSQNLSSYLISIQNAGSCAGRVVPGLLADKVGRFNMYVFGLFLSAVLTAGLWIPASSHVAIIFYAALYGFSSGIALTLWQPMIAEISPIQDVGARLGAVSAFQSFSSLLGVPVAGAIIDSNNGKYWGAATFAAIMMCTAGTVAMIAKIMITKNPFSIK
ncbi:major facilitator superfamily domain-containing protein [Lipomyces oligophaga]|uniref:major facilitator superfamily domain-containing protein n=1 Tax=Lipomyces oligophaga TaxID=45792 RepID=UPI0034CEDDFD